MTNNNERLLICVNELARGTEHFYTTQILDSLNNLATIYASYMCIYIMQEQTPIQITHYSKYTNKIYSTMTDRLSTNKAVFREIEKKIGHLSPLYCQVHPLDSMTSATKYFLKQLLSTTISNLYGSESAVGNVLYIISKLRSEAKGKNKNAYLFAQSKVNNIVP